ncbi:MAG TPA: hypothetical protein VJU83_09655 [Burkholderiales bacterium]|nr:hypothetical protein [Burkholderiales bacterium]
MGMFDRLHHEGKVYQTKDLSCTLDELRIVGGRLICDEWHYEDVPKAERPYPDAPEGSLQSICGTIRRVVDRENVDMNYHGILTGCIESGPEYRRFTAKFTDGNLVSFVLDVPSSEAAESKA